MHIDWWTLCLQAINVLVLVWILSRFFFKPVAAIVAERRAAIAQALEDARKARVQAEAEQEKAQQAAAAIAASHADVLKKAELEAKAETDAILGSARAEADKLREAAAADIARKRQSDAAALADQASRLAADIAGKLLSRLPDESRIAGFVPGLAQGLSELPETVRRGVGAHGAPLRLKAARALTEAETEACHTELSKALGRPVDILVEVAPELIAGLEIDMPHAVVRNNFRADLARIAAALIAPGAKQPELPQSGQEAR